jgi:hypothetical protein
VFELDHLFICTDIGAHEADSLIQFGLSEGDPNVHPGQGTANRRFFFRNAMLELVWVHDAGEAQSELARPTQLWQRWSQRQAGVSPFGLCVRPTRPGAAEVPFPAWIYRPPYLPAPLVIHVGENTPLSEPMWFYLGFGRRPDDPAWPKRQPLEHAAGFREITQVQITTPGADHASAVAQAVVRTGAVTLISAPEHRMEITFDGGGQNRLKDFRPSLPLVFRW